MSKYKSTWHRMRELVILSLNIIYIKDILQFTERYKAKLEYLNFQTGSTTVTNIDILKRKHELHKRVKSLLEDILNSSKADSIFCFVIDTESPSLTRKQLEKGYALFNNLKGDTYALDLRNGSLLPILYPELNVIDNNLRTLEYTAQHNGPVYKYFEIDTTDPLKNELRY